MRLRKLLPEYFWDVKDNPWGTGMIVAGAVCDVLYVEAQAVPASLQYRPAAALRGRADLEYNPASGENDLQAAILGALDRGELDVADLQHSVRVLDRFLDQVRSAGRDY